MTAPTGAPETMGLCYGNLDAVPYDGPCGRCGRTWYELRLLPSRGALRRFHACDVFVSAMEVAYACSPERRGHGCWSRRESVRDNIALGKFIGTYRR